jgi:hypothetical protein
MSFAVYVAAKKVPPEKKDLATEGTEITENSRIQGDDALRTLAPGWFDSAHHHELVE